MSKMARTARAAMKEKARAMGGTADAQPLSTAAKTVSKPRMARKTGGAVETKVAGDKTASRADRKPRTKKADGGSLGMDIWLALPPALRRMTTPDQMARDANLATGFVGSGRALAAPSRALVTAEAPANIARAAPSEVSTAVRGAGESAPRARPDWYRAEGTVNVTPSLPAIQAGAPRTLFMAADRAARLRLGDEGADRERAPVDRGIGTRTDRDDAAAPDMVIRATRPAPEPVAAAPAESATADRLNAISLGQSRMGPIQRDEAPMGAAEMAAAQRMSDRRRAIEAAGPTDAPLGNFKRGGNVKSALKGRKSKPGPSRR
mgnify:CR=1 FL=1